MSRMLNYFYSEKRNLKTEFTDADFTWGKIDEETNLWTGVVGQVYLFNMFFNLQWDPYNYGKEKTTLKQNYVLILPVDCKSLIKYIVQV